jgi:hypothetical protein
MPSRKEPIDGKAKGEDGRQWQRLADDGRDWQDPSELVRMVKKKPASVPPAYDA